MNRLKFFKTYIRDYKVGALTASSKHVARRLLQYFPAKPVRVVEYGPGDGVITTALLAQLEAAGSLTAIETNPDFIASLQRIIDPRLRVVHGDVRSIISDRERFPNSVCDAVVSGIPFTLLRSEDRHAIVRETHRLLRESGVFLVYQFSPLMAPVMKKYFRSVKISFEPRNLPPYFIMAAKKSRSEV